MVFLIALFTTLSFALINGKPLTTAPDLVRLTFPNGGVCTGFFITKNYIVTAGHCLYSDEDKSKLQPTVVIEGIAPVDVQVVRIKPNPKYQDGPHHDIGLIETTDYAGFAGAYHITFKRPRLFGRITFHAAGKISLTPKEYGFSTGKDGRMRLGDFLFSVGVSRKQDVLGGDVSAAPNDSGAPMIDDKGQVIAILIKSSVGYSFDSFFPALSIGNMMRDEEDFLKKILKPKN